MCARLPDGNVRLSATNVASQREGSGAVVEAGRLAATVGDAASVDCTTVGRIESFGHEDGGEKVYETGIVICSQSLEEKNVSLITGCQGLIEERTTCQDGIKDGVMELGLTLTLKIGAGVGSSGLAVVSSLFSRCGGGDALACISGSSSSNGIKCLLFDLQFRNL